MIHYECRYIQSIYPVIYVIYIIWHSLTVYTQWVLLIFAFASLWYCIQIAIYNMTTLKKFLIKRLDWLLESSVFIYVFTYDSYLFVRNLTVKLVELDTQLQCAHLNQINSNFIFYFFYHLTESGYSNRLYKSLVLKIELLNLLTFTQKSSFEVLPTSLSKYIFFNIEIYLKNSIRFV